MFKCNTSNGNKIEFILTSGINSMQLKGDLFYDDHILSGEKRKL